MLFDLEDFWLEVLRQMTLEFRAKKMTYKIALASVSSRAKNVKKFSVVVHSLNAKPFINGIIHNGSNKKGREFISLPCSDFATKEECFSQSSSSYGITFKVSQSPGAKALECDYRDY